VDRRIQMLRTAMGPLIAAALEDPDVVEIMLNPDRTLWVDRLSSGRSPLGVELPRPMANASSAWSPRTSARRCIAASRC
jgi:Flp pilus assembly CpaF family ATPase